MVPLLTVDEFADWLMTQLGSSIRERSGGDSPSEVVLDSLEMTEAVVVLDDHGVSLDAGMVIGVRNLGDLYRVTVLAAR